LNLVAIVPTKIPNPNFQIPNLVQNPKVQIES
jgi:hypothetical protein